MFNQFNPFDLSDFDRDIKSEKAACDLLDRLLNDEECWGGIQVGDYAGSIGRVVLHPDHKKYKQITTLVDMVVKSRIRIANKTSGINNSFMFMRDKRSPLNYKIQMRWKGKTNKPSYNVGGYERFSWFYFPDYSGPEVFKYTKTADLLKEAKNNTVMKDRFGNVIEVGDPVVFVQNLPEGGVRLELGKITDFKAKKIIDYTGSTMVEMLTMIRPHGENKDVKIRNGSDRIIKCTGSIDADLVAYKLMS